MLSLIKKIINNQEGQSLILLSIGIAVFLGFAAITVDYGYLAWQRRELQNAADAAALAAAWELPNGDVVTEARKYANNHVQDSFLSAEKVLNSRGVNVKVSKEYPRLFGMIFKFFDKNAASSDIISAEATAQKTMTWGLDLLPLIDLDVYPVQDPKFPDDPSKQIPSPEMREKSLSEFTTFMKNRAKSTNVNQNRVTLWQKNDISGNFGLVTLTNTNDEKPEPSLIDIINQKYKLNLLNDGLYGRVFKTGHGQISSVETSNNDLSKRLSKNGRKGYIFVVLPSAVQLKNNGQPENLMNISEKQYILLYLTDMNLDINNKKIDGRIEGVYNIWNNEFPNMEDNIVDENVVLIK